MQGGALWNSRVHEALAALLGLRGSKEMEPLVPAIRDIESWRGWIGDHGAWWESGLPVGSGMGSRRWS